MLLAGCSALQIDVDVYKGPLVSQEDVQREQVVAMAMSAKTLLYTMRNQLLDTACPGWSLASAEKRRDTVISAADWRSSASTSDKQGAPATGPEICKSGVVAGHVSDFTRSRRLNDILSAYENRACPSRPTSGPCASYVNPLDAGRIPEGIDQLADLYAEARDDLVRSPTAKPNAYLKAKTERAFSRLLHALVDLGGRMQFLATNLWLIDGQTDSYGANTPQRSTDATSGTALTSAVRNKALIESIANNIVVHADDLRRQEALRGGQELAGGREALSADAAFATDAAANLRQIEVALADRAAAARSREAAAAAEAEGGAVAAARAEKAQRGKEVGAASESVNKAKALQDSMAWLMLTSGTGSPLNGAPLFPESFPQGFAVEAATAWRADQKVLEADLKLAGLDKIEVEQLRLALAQWLTDKAAGAATLAIPVTPRSWRLKAAATAAASLATPGPTKPDPVPRKAAWAELSRRMREAMDFAGALVRAQQSSLKSAQDKLAKADNNLTLAIDKAKAALATTTGRPSADYLIAQGVVTSVKATVLTELRNAGATPSAATVMAKLRAVVQAAAKEAEAKAPDTAARYAKADLVLQDILTAPQLTAGAPAQSSVEVLDGVITQLRYRHIGLLRDRGPSDDETLRTKAALEAAQEQRNDMTYLRPASSYLRSVYAATVTQTDSAANQWQNMLLERNLMVRLGKQLFNDGKELDAARAELDKAYWQNINSVKVGAAGSSNFVIAKDDVGNWYVKAMGSDPSAMVKAARNLALYNAGAGLNTDLLRVNDLRARIDGEDNQTRREEMRSELDGLTGSAGGPTVAERSRTLTLFRKNYVDLSQAQLDALKTRLGNQEFGNAIAQRWRVTLADGNADASAALLKAFDKPALKQPYDAAVSALAADTPAAPAADPGAATGTLAGKKIITALRSLQAWRGALKAEVQAADALTVGEQTKASQATDQFDANQRELLARVENRDKAGARLAEAEKARSALNGDSNPTQVDRVNKEWDASREFYAEAVRQLSAAEVRLTATKATQDAAQKLLAAAKARQAAATQDVDAVLKPVISDLVAQRLQVLRDTETAVKIVGSSAQ